MCALCARLSYMAESRLDSDVVSDAEPDSADVQRTEEDPDQQRAYDDLIKKYRIWLPPELKQTHNDILIIFAEHDRQYALRLQGFVNGLDFTLGSGERTRARAVLENETAVFVTSHVDWLEYALEYNTIISFLFSDNFNNDVFRNEMAKATFLETIINSGKQYCFIPVYLQDHPPAALSPYYKQLKPLEMHKSGWEDHISRTIEQHLQSRLEREENYRKAQIDYILKKLNGLPGIDLCVPAETDVHRASSDHVSECNLDVHANEQHLENPDEVNSDERLEPDGSCHSDSAAAAAACSAMSPRAAPVGLINGVSSWIENNLLVLYCAVATIGTIVAIISQRLT